jgi:LPS-assembly lipoprotein
MLLPEAQSNSSTGDRARLRDDMGRRAFGRLILACLLSTPLAACGTANGFQPLHGPTASGQRLDDRLAAIEFATIPGRVGQRVRNELIFQRDRGGASTASSAHRLDVTLKESVISTMIDRAGNTGSQIYQLEAQYQLIDTKTKKVLFEGRSLGRGGFDRFESVYSNVRAREDAENRVARTVATDIKTRLSTYLSSAS